MKFIYLDKEGNQVGPVDESVVVQGILDGDLNAETPIRNALLRGFRTMGEFDCFAEALAQAAPAPEKNTEEFKGKCSDWRYLRQIAQQKFQEDQNRTISAKLYAADAKVLRRVLAMLMDAVILMPVLLLIFLPAMTTLQNQGEQDMPELARQKKAHEIRLFTSRQEVDWEKQTALTVDAKAALEEASQAEKEKKKHSVNRAAINKLLPGTLRKLDNAYLKHNQRIEAANAETSAQPAQEKTKTQEVEKTEPANQELADYEASKKVKKKKKVKRMIAAAYKSIPEEDRPQVLLSNMPGGDAVSALLPSMVMQWEDRFYADGFSSNSAMAPPESSNQYALRDLLITGYAEDGDTILLRTGGDIRRLTYEELTNHFATSLKLAALVLLLYYTLAFSIFAQTVGMWFWGIFLTRKELAEVLPLRALLYAATMLFFGILMIPMVLITKRSLADWICGVRQVGVGSVSKAS